jgi:hypothetical protein
MSYRLQKGAYHNFVTKRTYQFREGDKADQRRAKAQMQNDVDVLRSSEATRVANIPPDTRTAAEKVADGIVHKTQPSGDAGAAMLNVLADLRLKMRRARTQQERNQLQRRIDVFQERAAQHQAEVDAKAAWQARLESKEVQEALAEGQALVDLYRFRPDVAQDVVEGAKAALADLRESLDVDQFKATQKSIREKHNINRQREIAELRTRQAELQSQLLTVREDAPPPEATPPEAIPVVAE